MRADQPVPLTPKAFEILLVLVRNSGHTVEKHELLRQIWGQTFVEEGNLAVHIFALRKALGCRLEGGEYIETVPRRGYRFTAPVAEVSGASAPNSPATPALIEARSAAGREPENAAAETPGVSSPVFHSLAVLPLEDLSGDPSQEYFGDGITDELINCVARIPGLRVTSRTSSMQYKHTRKSAPQIGRELEVDGLLEGTLQHLGHRLRLRLRLIHAATDRHFWAENYDRELTDVLALESEIAQDVASQLWAHVEPQHRRSALQPPVNPVAFEHYLKGRYFWNRRDGDALDKGVENFQRAIELDPTYAPAYAGLASTFILIALFARSTRQYMLQAREAACEALRLDPTISEAHSALAAVAAHEYNFPKCGREHQRAVTLEPNNAIAHQWYASTFLIYLGRFEEANREMKLALSLDPVSRVIGTNWGAVLYFERRYDDAYQELCKVIEMAPEFSEAHFYRALVLMKQERHREAWADVEHFWRHALTPRNMAISGFGLGAAGKRTQARTVLNKLKSLSRSAFVSPWWFAIVYMGLGDTKETFVWLDRAYEEGCLELVTLGVAPFYDPLRGDPRYLSLLARLGLKEIPAEGKH